MTLGEKTLTLEPSFYIEMGDKCYCRILPGGGSDWEIGDAWLNKFYTEIDLTKDKEKVTFYDLILK